MCYVSAESYLLLVKKFPDFNLLKSSRSILESAFIDGRVEHVQDKPIFLHTIRDTFM